MQPSHWLTQKRHVAAFKEKLKENEGVWGLPPEKICRAMPSRRLEKPFET